MEADGAAFFRKVTTFQVIVAGMSRERNTA